MTPEEDQYIFLSDDPAAPIKVAESQLIRRFEESLSDTEKMDCKNYIKYLNWPVTNMQQRQNRNLAVMCYVDGLRYQKGKLIGWLQGQNAKNI